ncbi:MAG: TRAP transporter large permease [Woeseia sp.]
MDPVTHAIAAFALLVLLLGLGVPVAYALGLTATILTLIAGNPGEVLYIAASLFEGLESFELLAIPLFVLMGAVIAASPAAADLYSVLHRLLSFPGGLGISTIGGCALFSALSGSSPATAAAIGSSGVPEMMQRGYPPRLATGIIVGGGTLGILIPPSVVLIIYGIVTETSIGSLFLAGIVPALIIVLLFAAYVAFAVRQHERSSGELSENAGRANSSGAGLRVVPFFALIVGVMLALYGGWASPSEVAALSAVGAVALVSMVYRVTALSIWGQIMMKAVRETSFIMLIAAFSYYLNQYLAFQGSISEITALLLDFSSNRWVTLFLLCLSMLALGLILPPFAIVVIVAPMFLPFVLSAGFDPVWFGILVTIIMEMGLITPPIGVNLFVVQAIAPEVSLRDIMLGSAPFLGLLAVTAVILCIAPGVALWLPGLLL